MGSPFDDAFAAAAAALNTAFGVAATYTKADGDVDVPLTFTQISKMKTDRMKGHDRVDCWVLVGLVLISDIAEPAKGDLIVLSGDARTYLLTQTPVLTKDEHSWECEFMHDVVTRRGGSEALPIY